MVFASSGGQAFLVAAQRAAQTPKTRLALILRLSEVAPDGPRGYHRRVARAIFHDAAQAHGGEMFELERGDMALLCQAKAGANPALHPNALPATMDRLFRIDLAPDQRVTTLWLLERDSPALLGYAAKQAEPC